MKYFLNPKFEYAISSPDQISHWMSENGHVPGLIFCGRSNVGKSSLINTLYIRKTARTSKTPGRTQCINIFSFTIPDVEKTFFFFDLPGFGYAKVSKQMGKEWNALMDIFFQFCTTNKLVIHIQDARHPNQDSDLQFLDFIIGHEAPKFLVFNKMDKLKNQKERSGLEKFLADQKFKSYQQIYKVSAEKGDGTDSLGLSLKSFLLGQIQKTT
jgi:GTP-binding protein